jgi:sec-independent protein translocase protein TatA
MDFLGIGIGELLLILVILVIFVPPTKLPEIARQMGKLSRKLKEATRELTREIEGMEEDIKSTGREAKGEVQPKVGILDGLKEISDDVRGLGREVRSNLNPIELEKGFSSKGKGGARGASASQSESTSPDKHEAAPDKAKEDSPP